MPAATPILLKKQSQVGLVKYMELASNSLLTSSNLRAGLRAADQAYMRENDWTKEQWQARQANKRGDPTKIQNIVVPIIMPQVESSVETQMKIFCSEFPIFSFVASPEKADIALQYNTIMQDNQKRGGWIRQLQMFFRDGFKYNLHALEATWCSEKIWTIETDTSYQGGAEGKAKELLWAGNKLKRMDMYNTFFDTRVAPAEVHIKGEFAGYVELMSRMELKRYINSLPNKLVDNINPAFNSGIGGTGDTMSSYSFYLPDINPGASFIQNPAQAFDWMSWAGIQPTNVGRVQYKNSYEVKTIYARIIPADFEIVVPSKNTPQIWKFVVVNNTVLIYAERQTNAHDYLPIVFGQPLEDGLRFQTKSFSQNLEPFQEVSSALWNMKLASARRRLTDRGLYNPLLVRMEDINSPEPNAKIPLRSSMYGRKLEDAYHQIPFDDANSQFFVQEADAMYRYSQITSGKNNPALGQFQKGNKNNPEFETTMANANSRDQTTARFTEDQVFTPVKEIFKLNILQYQPTGQIYNTEVQGLVNIDPLTLRKTALDFKVGDGLLPAQKEIQSDELQVAFQTIQSTQQLQSGYNVVPMFSYIMKTRGLDGLNKFEKSPLQLQYEQALGSWQQVAVEAMKAGQKPPPQPQMPPQLIQELRAKAVQSQQEAATSSTPTGNAVSQTAQTAQPSQSGDINIGQGTTNA
jgi:hypothetical protein